MRGRTSFIASLMLASCVALVAPTTGRPQAVTGSGARLTPLTPLDHVEIRQLAARYAHAVDQGAYDGHAYADLFAPGAAFGKTSGRDELAKLAKQTSRGPQTAWHFIVNHVIEPTEQGAKGKEYMVHLRYGEPGQPNAVWGGGHYEDTYVKTREGWRFGSRQFIPSEGAPSTPPAQSAMVPAPVGPSENPTGPALAAGDYLDIEQLVYNYGWALDSGDRSGFAYADLFTADGTFTGTNQGPAGRTYQGRDQLAALARGPARGPLNVGHAVTNLIVTPTADGAMGRVYVGIFEPGTPGSSPGAGHGGFYDDIYVRTAGGWRFRKRTFYESKWGEPAVPTPPPVARISALRGDAPARRGGLDDRDRVAIQQLVAALPYAIDMNADDGAAYANAFTPDGTFACVRPDTGNAPASGPLAGCAPHSEKFTLKVRPQARGRESLARTVTYDHRHGPSYVRHFVFNHVIEPRGRGAVGKAYVVLADIIPRQKMGFAHPIFSIGRYDDEYVKTPQGWRIRSRVLTAVGGGVPTAGAIP